MPIYEMRKFVAPEFIFGVGSRRRVAYYARHMMARRVFIVSDPGVIAAGWLKDIQSDLSEAGIDSFVFHGLTANPKDHEVMEGASQYAREHCDVIVAIGGGSALDCAKGIGIVHANNSSILVFEGVDQVDLPGPPLICVPTTAGSSADISQFCIIVNTPERYKMAVISKTVVPDVAQVDPETTSTMPPYLTACTGIDALTHAIEAYVSTASSPVVDVHALAAIRLVLNNVARAVADPNDMAARENMSLASLQAGLAFSNASLGAVHAMAHSLGGYKDLPHGECNALLLPHVIDFNFSAAPERFRIIAEAMGLDPRGMSTSEVRAWLLDSMRGLRNALGIKDNLTSKGIRVGDIPVLADKAVLDPCLVTNPKNANKRDIQVIYEEAT